jgi:hypothetical protein
MALRSFDGPGLPLLIHPVWALVEAAARRTFGREAGQL